MGDVPLFSIVIPTFNRATQVMQAIQSVINQGFGDWELLVVDDGSTDDSRLKFSDHPNERIHYFYIAHRGRSAARNYGIKKSKGQYICFLDSDDYYFPDHLSQFYKYLKEHDFPTMMLRTGSIMIDSSGVEIGKTLPFSNDSKQNPVRFFAFHFMSVNAVCISKEILNIHKFDERFSYFEDTHLFLRILAQFPFAQINAYTNVYNVHENSMLTRITDPVKRIQVVEENVAAIKHLFSEYQELLSPFIPSWLPQYLVHEKYLSYATQTLELDLRKLSYFLFWKSLEGGASIRLTKSYLNYLLKVLWKITKKKGANEGRIG